MFQNSNLSQSLCSDDTIKVENGDVQEESEKIYQDILNHCNEFQTNFIDDQFPHSIRSIGVFDKAECNKVANSLQWTRPTHILTEDEGQCPWTVFNNPTPSDIEQSRLFGDCWLMAAMAVIAEKPNILNDIFPSKEYSPQGVYRVKLCVEGEWKVIIVDDFLPCHEDNQMATAIGRRNQLWVPLIEKAAAKALGSYSMLTGGTSAQGLLMLTGAACKTYSTPKLHSTEVETFWGHLMDSKSSGFLMCGGSGDKFRADHKIDFRGKGLLGHHGYSILDVDDQYGYRLLRVRNPWGQFVWNGNWSDVWEGWPHEMRENLLTNRMHETGAFWIELDDFLKMFINVTICKPRPNWNEFRQSLIVGIDKPGIQFVVTETCEVFFVAFQKGSITMKQNNVNDIMLSVHRISSDGDIGPMVVRSERYAQKHATIDEFFLNPGQYVVMCFDLKIKNSKPMTINLVCYSSKQILFGTIRLTSQMFNYALRQIVLRDGYVFNEMEKGGVVRTLTKDFSGLLVMVDNFMNNTWLHFELDCRKSINMPPSRNSLRTIDAIPPMSYAIVNMLSINHALDTFELDYHFVCIPSKTKYIDSEKYCKTSWITRWKNWIQCKRKDEIQNWPILDDSDTLHSSHSLFMGFSSDAPRDEKPISDLKSKVKHLFSEIFSC